MLERVDAVLRVETPENVWLTFRLAGVFTRFAAWIVDVLLILAVVMTAGGFLVGFGGSGGGVGLYLLLLFAAQWCYFWFSEAFSGGRTLGKRLVGLRVVKIDGRPIGFHDAALRNLLRVVDWIPASFAAFDPTWATAYGLGVFSVVHTRHLQRLGDLAAGTVVVRETRAYFRADLSTVFRVPPIAATEMSGAYRPSDRTLTLIERFFRRYRELHPARAQEIASLLAIPVSRRLGYVGEGADPETQPVKFLLSVLRTFGEYSESEKHGKPRRDSHGAVSLEGAGVGRDP